MRRRVNERAENFYEKRDDDDRGRLQNDRIRYIGVSGVLLRSERQWPSLAPPTMVVRTCIIIILLYDQKDRDPRSPSPPYLLFSTTQEKVNSAGYNNTIIIIYYSVCVYDRHQNFHALIRNSPAAGFVRICLNTISTFT